MFSEQGAQEEHAVWLDETNIRLLATDDAFKLIQSKFGSGHHFLHLHKFHPVDFPVIDFLHENNFHAEVVLPHPCTRFGDLIKLNDRIKNRFSDREILVAVAKGNWPVVQYLINKSNIDFPKLLNRNIDTIFSPKSKKSYPNLIFTLTQNNVSFDLDRFRKPIEDYQCDIEVLTYLISHHNFSLSPSFLHKLLNQRYHLDFNIKMKKLHKILSPIDYPKQHPQEPIQAVEEKLSVTRRRLELRGTESAQEIDKRQKNAITAYAEFEANRHLFDHELVNDDLNEAVEHLTSNLKTIQTRVNERGHNHSFLLNHQLEFAIKNGAQIPENLSPKQLLFLHARNLLPMDFQKPPIKYNTNFKVTERLVTEFGYTISPSLFNDINLLCFALKNGTKNLQRKEPIKFHDNLYDIEYLVVEHEFQISQDFLVNCNTSFLEILSEKWIDFLMNHGARVPNFKEWLDMTRNVKIEKMKTLQDTWDLFNRMLKELNPSDFSEYCSELLLLALKRNLHEAISILCRMEFYDGINACPNYQWCVSELEKSEMNHASFVSIQGCLYVMGKRDLADITNNAEWLKDPKGMAVHVRDLLCECVSCNVSLKLRDIFGFLRPAAVKKYGECDVFVWKKRMEQDFFDDLEESIECDDLDDLMKLEWCVGLNVFVRKMDDQVDIVWVSSIAEVVELFVDGVECLARLIEEYCGLSQTVRMNFFKNRVLHGKKKRRERAIVKLAADVERNFFCVYTRWERVSNESGFRVALFRVGSGGVSSLMCGGSVV